MDLDNAAGVIKFSYHSPRSSLPIPDFAGDKNDKGSKKTEPYFFGDDSMAENYLKRCYPRIIRALVDEDIPYLFWVTRNQEASVRHPQVWIGYLEPTHHEIRPTTLDTDKETGDNIELDTPHLAVYGRGNLFRFEDALPTEDVFGHVLNRIDFTHRFRIGERETDRILDHFSGVENIVAECAEELARLRLLL